jgi:hypothetical protein
MITEQLAFKIFFGVVVGGLGLLSAGLLAAAIFFLRHDLKHH